MSAEFSADEIVYATGGRLSSGILGAGHGRLCWRTEDLRPGDWFVAVPEPFYDPHDELHLIYARGASGCVVNRKVRYPFSANELSTISVTDTRTALLDLLRYWRHRSKVKVVAVSGSSGRRATMMLLSQFLGKRKKVHLAFMKSISWESCLESAFAMPDDTEILICELGAIERGDVSRISAHLEPDIAVLTPVRHPTGSLERDEHFAAMYCELLENVNYPLNCDARAIVYDLDTAVHKRSAQVLRNVPAQMYSSKPNPILNAISESSLAELSDAMEELIDQKVTRADLWCALETAAALGVPMSELEDWFTEIQADEQAMTQTTKESSSCILKK